MGTSLLWPQALGGSVPRNKTASCPAGMNLGNTAAGRSGCVSARRCDTRALRYCPRSFLGPNAEQSLEAKTRERALQSVERGWKSRGLGELKARDIKAVLRFELLHLQNETFATAEGLRLQGTSGGHLEYFMLKNIF